MCSDFRGYFQTLILEVEQRRREQKKAIIFDKMVKRYRWYCSKHRAAADLFQKDPEFRVFREGLEQREAHLKRREVELEKAEDELVRSVARSSELEALLKARDDELELTRGVAEENADLQCRVADLTAKLETRAAEISALRQGPPKVWGGGLTFKTFLILPPV